MNLASRASPRQWLILWAPVWLRSSRLRWICAPPELVRQAAGVEDGAGAADVVGKQRGEFLLEVFALADGFVGDVDVVHGLLEVRGHQLTTVGAE